MQKAVLESCKLSGTEIPAYHLTELIGKGSFGRVYKGKSLVKGELVAIKIIDIDQSDTVNPKFADTYSDLLKEIKALKLLSRGGAKNINLVIEAIQVGQSMWVVTEYCAGGSVSTLMRPTAPGGLQEKWIIPILREVAVALRWVHGEGIIHRDLKGANILVTEDGRVQLCDFGVAGVVETKVDKRTTVIGTPHWMAPELFDQRASYSTEVDIWAFGAMAYEIASGKPPNVMLGMDLMKLGAHLKRQSPRLEGNQYSPELKDMIACCLQKDISKRPTISKIQRHRYIYKTEDAYPTSSLSHLVRAFRLWEAQGGERQSLFSAGGAQRVSKRFGSRPSEIANDEDWNFSTTAAFDKKVLTDGVAEDVFDVYGAGVDYNQQDFNDDTIKPMPPKTRRRHPPDLPRLKAPIEKVFDPYTLSRYDDNSKLYYGGYHAPPMDPPPPPPRAILPTPRESLIDLDASFMEGRQSQYIDLHTLRHPSTVIYDFEDVSSYANYTMRRLSDPADTNLNRRTQDWKFPFMTSPATPKRQSILRESNRYPLYGDASLLQASSPIALKSPSEAILSTSAPTNDSFFSNRLTVGSLINFDVSFPDLDNLSIGYRPTTSLSKVESMESTMASSSSESSETLFELERHISFDTSSVKIRDPSFDAGDDLSFGTSPSSSSTSSSSSSSKQTSYLPELYFQNSFSSLLSHFTDTDLEFFNVFRSSDLQADYQPIGHHDQKHISIARPYLELPLDPPDAPSAHIMEGHANNEEVKNELRRLARSLSNHLSYANSYITSLPARKTSGGNGKTRKKLKRSVPLEQRS